MDGAPNLLSPTPIPASSRQVADAHPTERRHVNDVNETDGHNYDIQSEAAHASKSERAAGTGASQATTQKGGAEFANKAKKEHPKAPEPIIGMNEERGGKGH